MVSVLLCNQYPVAIASRHQTHSLSLNNGPKSYNADMASAAVHHNAQAEPAVVSEQQIKSVPLISVSPRALRYRRANESLAATQRIIQF